MSKITLTNLVNLQNETTAVNAINANNAALTTAFDNNLSRDGTTPNTMSAPLDMNSQQIINLPTPATANSPVRLVDVQTGGTITNIPPGGNTNDRLIKTSNTDYVVGWGSEANDLVAGTNIAITGTSPATIATIATPTFTTVNTATVPTTVDTLVARNTTDTLTNKTLSTGCAIPASQVTGTTLANSVTASSLTSLGSSPTLVTPILGTPTSGTLTNCTIPASAITGATLAAGVTASSLTSFGSSPTLVTPTIGAATATSINKVAITAPGTSATLTVANGTTLTTTTSTSVGAGQYLGEPGTGSATAGNIGEYVSASVVTGSAIALTTTTSANITSISLTAGDWDVSSMVYFNPGATTSITQLISSQSQTTAVSDFTAGAFAEQNYAATVPAAGPLTLSISPERISLSGTTTIFLVTRATFTASTLSAWGIIRARRAR